MNTSNVQKRMLAIWLAVVMLLAAAVLPGLRFGAAEKDDDEPEETSISPIETKADPKTTDVPPIDTGFDPEHYILGDLNFDGELGIEDILIWRDLFAGYDVPSEEQIEQIKRIRPDGRITLAVCFTIRDIIHGLSDYEPRLPDTDTDKIIIKVSSPDINGNQIVTVSLKNYKPPDYLEGIQLNIVIPTDICTYISQENYSTFGNFDDQSKEMLVYFLDVGKTLPHYISTLCSFTIRPNAGKVLTAADFSIACLELFYAEGYFMASSDRLYDPGTGIAIVPGPGVLSGATISAKSQSNEYLSISAQDFLSQAKCGVRDIGLDYKGIAIQPVKGKTVTVYMPVLSGYDSLFCTVFRAETDSSLADMEAVAAGDYLVFDTNALGTFICAQPPKGDIDHDFSVSIADILYLRDIIFGGKDVTDYILWAAGALKPDDINVNAILKVRDIIFGL